MHIPLTLYFHSATGFWLRKEKMKHLECQLISIDIDCAVRRPTRSRTKWKRVNLEHHICWIPPQYCGRFLQNNQYEYVWLMTMIRNSLPST